MIVVIQTSDSFFVVAIFWTLKETTGGRMAAWGRQDLWKMNGDSRKDIFGDLKFHHGCILKSQIESLALIKR